MKPGRLSFHARKKVILLLLLIMAIGQIFVAELLMAQNRFPKPEFETDYQQPQTTTPEPRGVSHTYQDAIILIMALILATYLALKRRSRTGIFLLTIFSVLYFGFRRQGCICPIGAIQNVTLGLFHSHYLIPISALIFFFVPLIFTLFFGRTFCAAVCPLGAIQELFVIHPLKVPTWLQQVLGFIPYIYLGFAVLFAATNTTFLICRLDPFVGFFRMSADFEMLLFGAGFLILGVFVARPYCRFVCPYGVLLRWVSSLAKWHVTITPDDCIQCRLCETACPFGAIQEPTPGKIPEARIISVRRLGLTFVVLPFLMLLFGWIISQMYLPLSRMHPTVALAEQIEAENQGKTEESTLESRTFRTTGTPLNDLIEQAITIQQQFRTGGWFLGAFLGLALGLKLIGLSIHRHRTDYAPDRAECISCARCFAYCPRDQIQFKDQKRRFKFL